MQYLKFVNEEGGEYRASMSDQKNSDKKCVTNFVLTQLLILIVTYFSQKKRKSMFCVTFELKQNVGNLVTSKT